MSFHYTLEPPYKLFSPVNFNRLHQAKRDRTHTDYTRQNGTVHLQITPGKTGRYTYRLHQVKRDGNTNEPAPSREILVSLQTNCRRRRSISINITITALWLRSKHFCSFQYLFKNRSYDQKHISCQSYLHFTLVWRGVYHMLKFSFCKICSQLCTKV